MEKNGRLLELDCLRGIAAITVVLFHISASIPALHGFFDFGCTGVELFFLISGFVIFLTIKKTKNAKHFIVSRFARIYPAYWACVSITTLAIISWEVATRQPLSFPNFREYCINLTMFQYYFDVKNIDDVYWTLTYELLFYGFVLLLYLLNAVKNFHVIGYIIVITCLACLFVLKPLNPGIYSIVIHHFPIINYFALFIAGITFYQLKFDGHSFSKYFLVILCLITQTLFFHETGKIAFLSYPQYLACLLVYFSAFFLYITNLLGFIINSVTLFLGKISYSLYLIHYYISYRLLIPILHNPKYFHLNDFVSNILIVLPIVLIAASLINKFIEIPATRCIKTKMLYNKTSAGKLPIGV